ncbi:hypothetical protein LRR80_00826 [Streptomyces sp. RO-S4]|nr:hypothetical protein [Streptomyces sp. RO-S4]
MGADQLGGRPAGEGHGSAPPLTGIRGPLARARRTAVVGVLTVGFAAGALVVGAGPAGPEQTAAFAVLVVQAAGEAVEGVQVDGRLQFDRSVQHGGGQAGQRHGHLGERGAAALRRFPLRRAARAVETESDAVGVGDVVGEQRVGDEDDGRGAAVRGRLQGDPDVLALGEPADHEQAEPVGVGELELGGLGEPEVGVEEGVGGHTEAPVVDLQGEAVADAFADDLHGGVRRGEHRGVLQQFGHQVGEVGDGRSGDGDPGQAADLDALVVLDLGDGGAHHVHQLHGLAPLPGGGGTGEDHQALGVPAHTGGQVVQPEEVGEFLGVVRPALHGVEQGELLVQQDLAAAGEVDENLGDAGPQSGLLDGGLDGGALKGVEGLADLTDLVLVVLQARDFGLDVDLFAGREAAHHTGQAHTGGLVGLQAQLPEVADEFPAHAHGEEQGDEQGGQAEHAGGDGLDDDAHGDGPHPLLITVAGLVVEGAELGEHLAGGGVPTGGGDPAGRSVLGEDGGLLAHPQRGGGGVAPEVLVAVAFVRGELRQGDVVQQGALGRQVGDVPDLGGGQLADDQGGAEQRVLAGQQFAGAGQVHQGAVLLVEFDVLDHVQIGQQHVAGVDQAVVEVEGLAPVEGAVVDAAAQGLDALEGVEGGVEFAGVSVHGLAYVTAGGVPADGGHGPVGGGAAALEGGEAVGGAGVGEMDEGLAAFLLQDTDGVLDGVADLLHHRRDVEQVARLAARDHCGEGPERGQGHQRHEEQRHDLPADGLPAKAHGLPQLGPPGDRGHTCASTNGASLLPPRGQLEDPAGVFDSGRAPEQVELSGHCGRLPPAFRDVVPGSFSPVFAGGWLKSAPAGNLHGGPRVLLCGTWGRNRPQEPCPAPGRRKTAQAGQPKGSRVFGHQQWAGGGGE